MGFEEKQFTRIPLDKPLRACRALTALGLCCQPISFQFDPEAKTGQHEAIVIFFYDTDLENGQLIWINKNE